MEKKHKSKSKKCLECRVYNHKECINITRLYVVPPSGLPFNECKCYCNEKSDYRLEW